MSILSNSEKSKILNNPSIVSREILKFNKIDFDNYDETLVKSCKPYYKKFTDQQIKQKTTKIYNIYKQFKDSVKNLSVTDLENILNLYDDEFFDGKIKKYMKNNDYKLVIKTDGEPTFTTEGFCVNNKCSYTITFPLKKFKFENLSVLVGGIDCKDQLECLQRAIEHELTHLIIFMFCGDHVVADKHEELFMNMVSNYFRHNDFRHYIF